MAVDLLRRIDHMPSRIAVDAERAWLAAIAGHCDVPIGAHAVVDGDDIYLIAVMGDQFGEPVRDQNDGR